MAPECRGRGVRRSARGSRRPQSSPRQRISLLQVLRRTLRRPQPPMMARCCVMASSVIISLDTPGGSGNRHASLCQLRFVDTQTKPWSDRQMEETVDGFRGVFEYAVLASRRIIELAWFRGVQLARHQMQIRHMADGRLRLVRYELDAMRMRQRDATHQTGDPAHLDDVGLHHADAGCDQIRQTGERVGLFAGGDRDVELPGDLAHRLHMVVLHRLLEPPVAELLQNAPDADRAADRVAVIGIKGEWETLANQSSDCACLGDVAGNVEVGLGAIVVEANLDRRGLACEPGFDNPQHLVHTAPAIAADRCVERHPGAPGTAEQLVDRLIEELALEVPERNVQCCKCTGQRAPRAQAWRKYAAACRAAPHDRAGPCRSTPGRDYAR